MEIEKELIGGLQIFCNIQNLRNSKFSGIAQYVFKPKIPLKNLKLFQIFWNFSKFSKLLEMKP